MLHNQGLEIKKQNLQKQQEIEQHKTIRKKTVPQVWRNSNREGWNSDKVLEKIMGIFKKSGVEIPDTVFYRVHRIGVPYVDKTTRKSCKSHCVKSVQIRSFFCSVFSRIRTLSLRIQSECWKIRTRKNSVFGHFSRSDSHSSVFYFSPQN